MSSYNSKFIFFTKELSVYGLKDTSYENLRLNALKIFVAEKDIVQYYSLDLPLRLKLFTGLCRIEISIISCVSRDGKLAISGGFINFFIL